MTALLSGKTFQCDDQICLGMQRLCVQLRNEDIGLILFLLSEAQPKNALVTPPPFGNKCKHLRECLHGVTFFTIL
jgi:hypothetical protein